MTRLSKIAFIFFVILPSSAIADSTNVKVIGRLEVASQSYPSIVEGIFTIAYQNKNVPWGSKIYLHHGFKRDIFVNGELQHASDWNNIEDVEMEAAGPYIWGAKVVEQMYSRGSSGQFTAIQFVFKIVFPDGHVEYDNGFASEFGFYQCDRPRQGQNCILFNHQDCELLLTTR